jgi:hypothetical protein
VSSDENGRIYDAVRRRTGIKEAKDETQLDSWKRMVARDHLRKPVGSGSAIAPHFRLLRFEKRPEPLANA